MKYYTTTETARELNTTVRTVSRWLKDGIITGEKTGDTWEITAAEVKRMRKERSKGIPRRLPVKMSMS